MPLPVALAFLILVAAALLLAAEVWGGPLVGARRPLRALAAVTFGAASIAGATLLTALAGGEWLLALALIPLTTLSILRMGGLVLPRARPWTRVALVGVVLAVGVAAALQVVPVPLTRGHLAGTVQTHTVERQTVRPYVSRPVRG